MVKKVFLFFLLISTVLLSIWFLRQKTFCANSISCISDLSGKYDPDKTTGEYMGKPVTVPTEIFKKTVINAPVLGKNTTKLQKKILVNLTTQELFAYEGSKLKYKFKISSGKLNPTPVGKFYIWSKLLATQMEGGERENNSYYRLPNVPYTMYFYNENVGTWNGYGIHGMYWYSDFGKPSTNGCIGLSVEDSEKLFYWTDPEPTGLATLVEGKTSTPVIVFGKATQVLATINY